MTKQIKKFKEELLAETNCIKRGLGMHDYKIEGLKMICQRPGCGKVKVYHPRPFGI